MTHELNVHFILRQSYNPKDNDRIRHLELLIAEYGTDKANVFRRIIDRDIAFRQAGYHDPAQLGNGDAGS